MSQFLLLQKFVPNVKFQSVMDRCTDSLFQCWSNIHELLFWIASVIINHWRLKEENSNTMVMDGNFIFGTQDSTTIDERQSLTTTTTTTTNIKPKKLSKVPLTIEIKPTTVKEKKMIVKKQSLFLVKNHVLSWKQKFSNRSPLAYEQVSPTAKRSFLRRLSSGNNVIYSDTNTASNSSNSKSEPSSPTVSILKSISFKLKRQDIMTEEIMPVAIESNSTRSRLFKRKPSMDTLN